MPHPRLLSGFGTAEAGDSQGVYLDQHRAGCGRKEGSAAGVGCEMVGRPRSFPRLLKVLLEHLSVD